MPKASQEIYRAAELDKFLTHDFETLAQTINEREPILDQIHRNFNANSSQPLVIRLSTMTVKEKVLEAVNSLPEDAGVEDAMERLLLIAKIERGLEQADSGKLISNEEVKQRVSKWLK